MRKRFGWVIKFAAALTALILLTVGGVVGLIESGFLDETLSSRAQAALNSAIGPRYRAEVGSTVIRFTSDAKLALEARDVNTVEQDSGKHLSQTASIRMALDPLELLSGKIAVTEIEADTIELDTALLPSGDPVDLAKLRVDKIPAGLENTFKQLDSLRGFVQRSNTNTVRLSGLTLRLPVDKGKVLSITIDDLLLARNADDSLTLDGDVEIEGATSHLSIVTRSQAGLTTGLSAKLTDAALTPFTLKLDVAGQPRQGLALVADVGIEATRGGDGLPPTLAVKLEGKPGLLYFDGNGQEVSRADINIAYDFDKTSVEFLASELRFGATSVPFTGAVIDLDHIDAQTRRGYGLDLLVSNGVAAPTISGEPPLTYGAQVAGRFLTDSKVLELDQMGVSSPLGTMLGTLKAQFGAPGSPEISFGSQAKSLQTGAVKQLWPFWMAPKARQWVLSNLFGGTVTNASIGVFLPAGRMPPGGGPMHLNENELRINFDIDDARLNVAGDIPPIRDTVAHFELKGPRIEIAVKSGGSYFASGRSVALTGGTFVMPQVYDKPLMVEMNMSVAGTADGVAELVTFRPIKALQRTGFEPGDFKGNITAAVEARFGIVSDQHPPPPVWKTAMVLTGVDVGKPVAGHQITNLTGKLDIDPQSARLQAEGRVDDVAMSIQLVEPVDANSKVARERVISATLDSAERDKLAPGLGDVLQGSTKVEISRVDDKRQAVSIDLGSASLSVPWIGWTKGSGIAASATFDVVGDGDDKLIDNFELKGDGFGARGKLTIGKAGLSSADFSSVRLASADDFGLKLKRGKAGYDVAINGQTADVRSVISRVRAAQDGGGSGSAAGNSKGSVAISLRAKLGKIIGFNDETLTSVSMAYGTSGSKTDTLAFSGITDTGQAVVTELANGDGGEFIHITSGDAGAIARFADLYGRIQGGLLNVKLRAGKNQDWSGSVDIRSFKLANEERLQSIVSTPVGEDGRSLNGAVKRDIDVRSERFQRGFARLIVHDGTLRIENGVVRGEQVGATFQGTLRDAAGNMDMTGTFMPAYGLNRLFAELPIIGIILGNGSDRGLLGITFRLKGSFDAPRLTINPLSLIAPGVFRQIFEFQ